MSHNHDRFNLLLNTFACPLGHQYPTSSLCCHLPWSISTPWNQSECIVPRNRCVSAVLLGWLAVVMYFEPILSVFQWHKRGERIYIIWVVIYDAFRCELPFVLGNAFHIWWKTYICVRVKFPLFLSDFNQILIFFTDFRKMLKYQILLKSVQWEPSCSRRTDGRSHRYDEANSRFSQFWECAYNMKKCKLKLKIIILSPTTFLQKCLLPSTPRRVHRDKYVPHTISRRIKNRGRQ